MRLVANQDPHEIYDLLRKHLDDVLVRAAGEMLDLLVAANMGLWWGTWERSF